jgi:Amt family ammonium transporter
MGALDYAGGGPVHLTSGVGALAYSIWLGKRKGYGTNALAYRPQNIIHVCLGTALLWFGWLGFNGGSALAANFRAASAMTASNLSASVGGLTWMLIDWRLEHKWSAVGFCSGAISGLVTVTPAAGFIAIPSALAFGVVGGALCNYATQLKVSLSPHLGRCNIFLICSFFRLCYASMTRLISLLSMPLADLLAT